MIETVSMAWIAALVVLALALLCIAWWERTARGRRRNILIEDALKQIWVARDEGRSLTPSALGGALGLSQRRALDLVQSLEAAGHVRLRAHTIELTETGERIGFRVLRGHRLWERYLADEVQRPLGALHEEAERTEHRLTADDIDALADHLGHPRTDPHGDLIPTVAREASLPQRTALTDWPIGEPARVVHMEDEPVGPLAAALRAGIRPGGVLRVTARDSSGVTVKTETGLQTISPAVAGQIDVRGDREADAQPHGALLSALSIGTAAQVTRLDDRCSGLMRRRLLDLGFTSGAEVKALLSNFGSEARAYQIRGTKIALREEQADLILIGPPETWKAPKAPTEDTA